MDKEILKKEIREELTKIKGIREKLLKKMDEDDWEDFKQFEIEYDLKFEEKFDEAVKRNKLKKFLNNMSESLYWIFVDYIWQNEKGTFFPEDMICILKNAINKIKNQQSTNS